MSAESQYEREENAIHDAYECGDITLAELRKELAELVKDYQASAIGSAERAYEEELRNDGN